MNDKIKKVLPHVIAIILFLGLALIYFYPVIMENKELFQGDLENMIGWGKDQKDFQKQTGEFAFWSNSMFSGMPANSFTYMAPLFNIFNYFGQLFRFNLPTYHIGLLFVYLLGFYIFLTSIGCKPLLSVVGAIAYAFTTYNIIILEVGHVNKAQVMATMAPIIGGIILTYRKKYVWGAIVTILFTGMNVAWNHLQMSYYLLLMILVIAIVYLVFAIREKMIADYLKSSMVLVISALLAIAPALGTLMISADYSKDTMRGGAVLEKGEDGTKESTGLDIDYAFHWSYGKGETMTLLIPNFYGAKSAPFNSQSEFYKVIVAKSRTEQITNEEANYLLSRFGQYWGDQPNTAGPAYAGAIVCFLFILGLIIVKGREKWWLLCATILSFMLAWGKNFELFNNFIFYHLPMYSKFRSVSMALVLAEVTMATMAVLALKEIFDNKANNKMFLKPVYISAGITGYLCLTYALFGSALMNFSGATDVQIQNPDFLAALISDRKSMLASDSWRSFIFIAIAAGALWYYIHNRVKITYIIAFIGVLIFIDLWTVDKRFLNADSFVPKQRVREAVATEVDRQILADPDPNYRVFNYAPGMFSESRTSYFHKSIGGYSPVKLRRYQDIIEHHFSRGFNINVLNMLNTKYVIMQNQQGQQGVQVNQGALGNAWFVNELVWVDSPDEEIVALKDFDPLQTAFIDKEWQRSLTGWEALQHEAADSTAFIRLTNYANPGNLFYESSSSKPQLAVFSEVYYKTWRAYIDGTEVPLVRVNYILRGLQVPSGNHSIEFKCIDEVYLRGAKISKISSIFVGIILLSMLGFAGMGFIKGTKVRRH